jgi:apolipoprotein D and lipocalin family protein
MWVVTGIRQWFATVPFRATSSATFPRSVDQPVLAAVVLGSALTFGGCTAAPTPLQTMDHVDVPRFMGRWYVIANIPTRIERGAHNAVESYRLDAAGRVQTEFTFREGSFDGPARRYTPTGYVRDQGNGALWGMQFVWPIKAEYRVMFVDASYTQTVIGRTKRDYAWIMARTPAIPDADLAHHVALLERNGYDVTRLRLVPQQPEGARAD